VSQNKTVMLMLSIFLGLSTLSSQAHAGALGDCVETKMGDLGIKDMQNRWNPTTYVGKIHIQIIKKCEKEMASIQVQEKIIPASFHQEEMDHLNNDNNQTETAI
jgi:hypothetical protein